ncbi:glycosyltransferase [Mangrovibacterium lignilyticum]|uniref:glycosyltransferase n=1 Tax=Mangrovibacterium lignilyticum TaxID=2668052 RepID=UPI0013D0469C|nr:glycosyltransferase [Mangrovibacterium lignilyticum]
METVGILQPFIPHYREEFINGINKTKQADTYCYYLNGKQTSTVKNASTKSRSIKNIEVHEILLYNPFPLLRNEYQTLILMLHFGHLTTWLLLLTKSIHRKKIILWGQGISVKRYLKEEKSPSILLKWMISLADSVWIYTEKEKNMWKQIYPDKQIISLNNTITGVERIVNFSNNQSKLELKERYKIKQPICFIFCARFNNNFRRVDLLDQLIKNLDPQKYGFLIIGDGPVKPDFSNHNNVYDYGAVYDSDLKDDLFTMADLYIQPGWVGLSVVEALAYGKPVLTFKRSELVLQCVEYHYLKNKYNALLFENFDEAIHQINVLTNEEIIQLGINARKYVKENLMMTNMVNQAIKTLT